MASSTTTADFGAALSAAIAGGYVAQLNGGTYTVTQPIVIHINSTIQGALGINGGGATLVSQITNGSPVIEIDVGPGVDLRYLDLSNFNIVGNGQEGDGIKIVADGNDRWNYNWNINNVNVSHVGGYGLDMRGSIFEGLVSNSFMNNNGLGGAYISNSAGGGIASALRWFGGGFENNSGPGLTLDNGTRDMTVDGATIANNNGPGISAMSGITSVTASTFQDNHGDGVMFQNYGNFNNDTFTTSGSQTVGVSGYLTSDATLIGNTSTYTGSGPNPTELANLQGKGGLLETGNTGSIVIGGNVATGGLGSGDHASVSVGTQGVALPALSPITAATAAAVPSSTGTSALETTMHSAFAGGAVAHLTSATIYTVTSPIVINITSSSQGPVGIDLGGAKLESHISNRSPVIEIIVGPGVNIGSLTLSNFSIFGNGSEGDGIKIVADGTDRSVKLNLTNVNIEHVGGIGLDVLGNVQGAVTDTWMNGNAQGGARFANSANGGVASGLQWVGGGFRLNGIAGMILENGAHDMSVSGAYFVQNKGPGIDATSGINSVLGSGFENNTGSGAVIQGSSSFTDDTFSTYGPQTTGVGGYLAGGQVNLTGIDAEYYGPGSNPTVVANLQGQGTLAIAGNGQVVAGPSIVVTGGHPVVDPPTLVINPAGTGTTTTPPTVTERLVNDTGASSTDAITSAAAVAGTADPDAVLHFTVDGSATTATATANANGAWSYTPVGLPDGQHTIVASETNAAGLTGTSSLTFTLDTKPPAVTEALASSGAPALVGTGDADATVHFTVDGSAIAATATANSSGGWSFTPTGLASGQHTIVANETDCAGNTGTASITFTLAGTHPPVPTFTGEVVANGQVTLTGTTGEANDQISIYDGNTWLGFTTTGTNGNFSFSAAAPSNVVHTYGANAVNPAGIEGHGSNKVIVGSTTAATLTGTSGNDIINASAGNDTVVGGGGADLLTGGSGKVAFSYNSVSDSTPSAPDTITDFQHGVDKIDFTSIAGITASNGVPQFQGNITGTGNLTLNAHSVAYVEFGANTDVLINNTGTAETVATSDMHAAQMKIVLLGVHLGLTATDFHHA